MLTKANEDLDEMKTDINQGKVVAKRISNREFCYKVALFILALVLLAGDIGIAIWEIEKHLK